MASGGLPCSPFFFAIRYSLLAIRSVRPAGLQLVGAGVGADEDFVDLRMAHRIAGCVGQQVLLRDVGDVFGFRVFREQVIERLVLARPDFLRDREPPFLGIGEHRIDVVDHAAKRVAAVLDHLADPEFRLSFAIAAHGRRACPTNRAHELAPGRWHVNLPELEAARALRSGWSNFKLSKQFDRLLCSAAFSLDAFSTD